MYESINLVHYKHKISYNEYMESLHFWEDDLKTLEENTCKIK